MPDPFPPREADDSTQDLPSRPTATASLEVVPSVEVEVAAATHQGRVRHNNEDHFLVARLAKALRVLATSLPDDGARFSDEQGYLMIVADGMGGAAAGERASALAVESVESFMLHALKWFMHVGREENTLIDELRRALERADRKVFREAQSDTSLAGMGTTLTWAYSVGDDCYIVHAGDSRAYLFRDGELEQLTTDHTLAQLLVEGGELSPEAARKHPRRHVITNVIGGPSADAEAEIAKVKVRDGDVLLLCTDGLNEPVADAEIAATLARMESPVAAVRRLIDLALRGGGPDNVTVVVARYRVP
ncbi:MAG TPA: protein phosphatase 2C domain-containing protein [Isosphaeraceae bacterium]|jgi:protein phosphatase|nr:protein phosphatase 2C domain-containing protein [Isosphaeraceae bacterium]